MILPLDDGGEMAPSATPRTRFIWRPIRDRTLLTCRLKHKRDLDELMKAWQVAQFALRPSFKEGVGGSYADGGAGKGRIDSSQEAPV